MAVLLLVWTRPRGVNFFGDAEVFWGRARDMSLHHLPYRDFLWEFPPLTTPVLIPAPLVSERAFVAWFGLVMMAAEYGSLLVLRRGRSRDDALALTAYWTIVGLPLAAFTWFRFDFLAVFFATLGIVAIAPVARFRGQVTAGFAVKLWPVTLLAAPVLQRRWRSVIVSLTGVGAVVLAWYAFSPSGFREYLRYRRGTGLQAESTLGAIRMVMGAPRSVGSGALVTDAGRFAHADTVAFVLLALFAAITLAAAWRRPVAIVPLIGALTTAVMLFSRILSPQYLVWLLPFAALAWLDGERVGTIAFAVASLLTTVVIDRYDSFAAGNRFLAALVVARNVLLLVVGVRLLAMAFAARRLPDERVAGQPEDPLTDLVAFDL